MVQNLKPVVELNSEDWTELLEKYKLQNVMTSIHVQMLWYRMQRALEPEIWYEVHADEVLAAATLGGGVDRLLEEWSDKGQILDSYAADCLAMEALQCLYGLLEDELVKTNAYIERYQFPDPEEEEEENMAYILKQLQCSETIGLTDDGTLRPMKSVVFIGILTADQRKRCSTICRDCGRVDCPNRYSLHMGNYREPGALRYSYGYQRIFGK